MTRIPVQITFRGLAHSDALEADIHEHAARLEPLHTGLSRCRVLVEVPHRHHQQGRLFHVAIELTIPGGAPIVVGHEASLHTAAKDVEADVRHKETDVERDHRHARVAVRQAFDAARRRLDDHAQSRRDTRRNAGSRAS